MEEILVVKELKKYFGEVHAVDGVSFRIYRGEIISVIGPNGSGKTTLLNLISGFFKPDSGKIFLENKDITNIPAHKRVKMGISYSFQIVRLFEKLLTIDNVRASILSRYERLSSLISHIERFQNVKKESIDILNKFKIEPLKLTLELPHGQRKLLDISLAYSLQPKLILLDEPTSGVSSQEKHEVMKLILSAIKEANITAIVVEHDMDLVRLYCDRCFVMYDGKIIAEGKPEEVLAYSHVKEILLGR